MTMLGEKKKRRGVRGRFGIYRFADAESLFSLSAVLLASRRDYESDLYRLRGEEGYFLCIKEPLEESIRKESTLSPLSFVEEYGVKCKQSGFLHYIKERGECLIEHVAVTRLGAWKRSE